jgi:predicted MFS family arabinose efflux permease
VPRRSFADAGPSLTLVIAGLAIFSSGIFVSQSAATVLMGQVAGRARSAAAGLYVTFYYSGGSAGAALTAWFWLKGGWPACVGLFAAVSLITLILALAGGKSAAGGKSRRSRPLTRPFEMAAGVSARGGIFPVRWFPACGKPL